jgi:alpha-L-rhamnosidase
MTPISPRPDHRPSPLDQASFCWVADLPEGRNQFVSFERRFLLQQPIALALHLFADTRYRLFVNGHFVSYGPARFVTAHPEFDTLQLQNWLRAGENIVRVEVNYFGCSSFQSLPDGRPGFIAAGRSADGAVCLATPGDWRACIHRAWDAQAPLFSFAQNPAEIRDTRILRAELATAASLPLRPLPPEARPWGRPRPRSVPLSTYTIERPTRINVTGPLAPGLRFGAQISRPPGPVESQPTERFVQFVTWIHSPRAQSVALDCFWGDYLLNGVRVATRIDHKLGNHCAGVLDLRAGWNLLSGSFETLLQKWALLLGFPACSGLSLHARPVATESAIFALSPLLAHRAPPLAELPSGEPPEGWSLRANEAFSSVTPARLVAWDHPAEDALRGLPFARLPEVSAHISEAALWSFDFGTEYHGHPVLVVEAPAGSVLDIAYDDWLRADGCANIYNSNPFTDAADRFVLAGGREEIEVFHPRGGIHLQVTLRAPAGHPPATLELHDVHVRCRSTIRRVEGSFVSGDPLLDWTWRTAAETLRISIDDAYADCPWRERGSYIGDTLVNLHLHRLITTDLSVARRTLELFALDQLPNGQLPCCAPSWLGRPHEDFTLIWVRAVRDYWALTGDLEFTRRQLPVIDRVLASSAWRVGPGGLWNADGLRQFIDWGVLREEREGEANAVLNLLRLDALRCTAELAQAVGDTRARAAREAEAALVAAAIEKTLWDPTEGRFRPSATGHSAALHANILALRLDVGPASRVLAYLEPRLLGNLEHGLSKGEFSGYFELFYLHFLLPALANHGRLELAIRLLREHYGHLQVLKVPTLPECFSGAALGRGSCCHSWSGTGATFATEWILGFRQITPGDPDHWLLAPALGDLDRLSATIPHPRGTIHLDLRREGLEIVTSIRAPEGVIVRHGPATAAPWPSRSPAPATSTRIAAPSR